MTLTKTKKFQHFCGFLPTFTLASFQHRYGLVEKYRLFLDLLKTQDWKDTKAQREERLYA